MASVKVRVTRNVGSPDPVAGTARTSWVSLAPYVWIHIMLPHSWGLLMKSFFIIIIMRCNDAVMPVYGQWHSVMTFVILVAHHRGTRVFLPKVCNCFVELRLQKWHPTQAIADVTHFSLAQDKQLSPNASAWSTLAPEQCFLFPRHFFVDTFPLKPFCLANDSRPTVVQDHHLVQYA